MPTSPRDALRLSSGPCYRSLQSLYYGEMNFSTRIDFGASRNGLDLERGERALKGIPFFDLSQSNPTRTGFAHRPGELAAALSEEANALYLPDPKGLAGARAAIALHLGKSGRKVDESRLLLCASTSEAYSYLFKLLCDPGDAVLVPKPGYPLFDHLASLESVKTLGYKLEYNHPQGWSIDLDSIRSLLEAPGAGKARALVLINPNNPTGSYVHRNELESIAELCRRHSLALISDEVFHGYFLEPREDRVSLLGRDDLLCFVLDGLSKRLCLPQMKLGWIHVSGPEPEAAGAMAALELISDTYLSAGTPIMNGVGALLAGESDILQAVRERMKAVLGAYREALCYDGSPHRILACEGGWTALVQSPRLAGEEELARGLLREQGLYVHPGFFFDMEREAYFAFSLILRPEEARSAALRYKAYFDKILKENG